ncbi:MAG: hypothetical protein JO047_09615 [Alphaproteobacteria bacterium]|nr:hypothetical protein [Alphaproteobacteria bacterium]
MRKTIIAAVAASAITGAVAGGMVRLAAAQQTPPAEQAPFEPGQQPGQFGHHGMMGRMGGGMWARMHWMRHMHDGFMHGGFAAPGTFALLYHPADRQLNAGDVQKIAEAFLIWNGNHTWKVADVADNADSVGFAYAAPDGTVIARFSMDKRTGHLARVG